MGPFFLLPSSVLTFCAAISSALDWRAPLVGLQGVARAEGCLRERVVHDLRRCAGQGGGGVVCVRCRCRVHLAHRRHWLSEGPCIPLGPDGSARTTNVRFGAVSLHHSHRLRWIGQGWKCIACGATATQRARRLILPCQNIRADTVPQIQEQRKPLTAALPVPSAPSAYSCFRERIRARERAKVSSSPTSVGNH